jgi:hypothetical protein
MDLCVIPPILHLRQFPQKRHLVLSHLLQYKPYRDFYMERVEKGEYVILDNSAHENGIGEGPGKLLLQALTLMPHELVVPDALDDSRRTVQFSHNAVQSWYGSDGRMQNVNPRLMYVPQGKDPDDWLRCLVELLMLHETACDLGAKSEFTIGISKDCGRWEGGLQDLLNRARIDLSDPRCEVHLLGSGHDYWTAGELGKRFRIRSVDTAKPFVWAMHDMEMHQVGWPFKLPEHPPARSRDFFFRELHLAELSLAQANVNVLRQLVES